MTVRNVLQFLLWIALSSIALFGGFTGKWWVVTVILLCFMVWVLYLLIQNEKKESVHSATHSELVVARTELENYKRLRVRRADLLSRHVD
jgi:Ca2+/Na+ antiporter